MNIVDGKLSEKHILEKLTIGEYYAELYAFYQRNKELEKQIEKTK
jgi:hypothetical protein